MPIWNKKHQTRRVVPKNRNKNYKRGIEAAKEELNWDFIHNNRIEATSKQG